MQPTTKLKVATKLQVTTKLLQPSYNQASSCKKASTYTKSLNPKGENTLGCLNYDNGALPSKSILQCIWKLDENVNI